MKVLPHYVTFRYGQLSGLVEPIAGLLGAALVAIIVPILPYALAFAAVENRYLFDRILLLVIFQLVQPTGHCREPWCMWWWMTLYLRPRAKEMDGQPVGEQW